MPEARTILVCTANPSETARLRAAEEVRSLTSAWERSSSRSHFILKAVRAAQWGDLRRALLEYQPTIVHFIGHGALDGKGLAMEKPGGGAQLVPGEALAALFKEFSSLSCVVLNACYSADQAEVIHQHVPCVVGLNQRLEDGPRIEFAVAFYDAVFADWSYPKAFDLGKACVLSRSCADAFVLHFGGMTTQGEAGGGSAVNAFPLEEPGGKMAADSLFYLERPPAEADALRELARPGALIRIKGPREFGKSSLMARVLAQAAEAEGEVPQAVSINLREIDREFLGSLGSFLRHLCVRVTRQLKLSRQEIDEYWDSGLGAKGDCGEYFEDYLLPNVATALVLELDEVDQLLHGANDRAWVIDFFSMLRAWYEKGKTHKQWRKLRLVLIHSQDIVLKTLAQNQSPFNVGTEIDLKAFEQAQVVALAQRHGLEVAQAEAVAEVLMAFVGGHPQLVRRGLYGLCHDGLTVEKLRSEGATQAGCYGGHLQQLRGYVERDAQQERGLKQSLGQVLASPDGVRLELAEQAALRSLGLVVLQGNGVRISCELYRQYFSDLLGLG